MQLLAIGRSGLTLSSASNHNGVVIVPSLYVRHNSLSLKQGEIISDLVEFKLQTSEVKSINDVYKTAKFDSITHAYVIVVSQDCDLEWDYRARSGKASEDKLLAHILFCALFTLDEVRSRSGLKSELWKRVKQNQDERYHHLDEALLMSAEQCTNESIAAIHKMSSEDFHKKYETGEIVPELVADFKTTFSLPTEFTYWLVSTGQANRKGALFPPYLEDFVHRLYGFLGRVATPDFQGK